MLRRTVATALWAYFGWYLASYIAAISGVPSGLAIIGAILMAIGAFVDLSHVPGVPARVARPPSVSPSAER